LAFTWKNINQNSGSSGSGFGIAKAKVVAQHVMEALGGEEMYLLLILDLGTRWE
jgi:hypothetical protein